MTDPLSTLWTQQGLDATVPTPAALAGAEARLRRRVRRRDAIEYGAGALVVPIFVYLAILLPNWGMRIACAAIVIGVAVVLRNLWRRRPEPAPEVPSLDFYRAQLVRQRDMLRSVWRWYLAPLVPGLLGLHLAVAWASAARLPILAVLASLAVQLLLAGGAFYAIHWLNMRAARRLQGLLDSIEGDTQ